MLIFKNMDELMEIELDPPSRNGSGNRVFAASHACVCNPLKKPHYPKNWSVDPAPWRPQTNAGFRRPENCPFTAQHSDPGKAQKQGAASTAGLGMPNGGLQVVNPSMELYNMIMGRMATTSAVESYEFADQSLLSDLFYGRWVALPYIYNALKTMRWKDVHALIWRDDEIKNIHYILSPKPWDERPGEESNESHQWWWKYNYERLGKDKQASIQDGF